MSEANNSDVNKKDSLRFEIQEDEVLLGTRIKVIGVGGGGGNAVARMMKEGLTGVEFHVLNTDLQALQASPVPNKLAIGRKVTNGLGAGSDPNIGRLAALEDTERIIELLDGADMVFVTAGLGGGTGTGAAPVIASLAKELNALTVAVITKPFSFEGPRRMKAADKGLTDLASSADIVITIPNEKLLSLVPKGTSFMQAFGTADDVLRQAVQGIADIITTPGLINRDFSDIKSIMLGMGFAMMGSASAHGEGALVQAAKAAISSPLLDEGGVKGARAILINIKGSSQMSLHDVNEACELIRNAAEYEEVQVNFGMAMDEELGDEVRLTVIATGFPRMGSVAAANSDRRAFDEMPAPPPSIPMPEPEPLAASAAAASAPLFETEPEPIPVTNNGNPQQGEPRDDISLPAYLRRERERRQY